MAGAKMAEIILESTLTCPQCGHVKTETMPTDAWNAHEAELRRFLRHCARNEAEGDHSLQEVFPYAMRRPNRDIDSGCVHFGFWLACVDEVYLFRPPQAKGSPS